MAVEAAADLGAVGRRDGGAHRRRRRGRGDAARRVRRELAAAEDELVRLVERRRVLRRELRLRRHDGRARGGRRLEAELLVHHEARRAPALAGVQALGDGRRCGGWRRPRRGEGRRPADRLPRRRRLERVRLRVERRRELRRRRPRPRRRLRRRARRVLAARIDARAALRRCLLLEEREVALDRQRLALRVELPAEAAAGHRALERFVLAGRAEQHFCARGHRQRGHRQEESSRRPAVPGGGRPVPGDGSRSRHNRGCRAHPFRCCELQFLNILPRFEGSTHRTMQRSLLPLLIVTAATAYRLPPLRVSAAAREALLRMEQGPCIKAAKRTRSRPSGENSRLVAETSSSRPQLLAPASRASTQSSPKRICRCQRAWAGVNGPHARRVDRPVLPHRPGRPVELPRVRDGT